MVLTDNEFKLLKKGDKKIIKRLYVHYKDALFAFFMVRVAQDRDLASDLLSETIYSALKSISKINDKYKIQSWLFQIAQRRLMDYLRKQYAEKRKNEKIMKKEETMSPDVSQEIIDKEKIVTLHIALDNLKENYSQVLKKKYLENKSQKEIADDLGTSITAIESLLYRARKALKKELCFSSTLFEEGLS